MTQSIIVYRNPAEAALWESGMAFPVFVGMFVAILVAVGSVKVYEKISPRGKLQGEIAVVTAIIAMIATMVWLS